jgi:hypothetical protein
MATRLSFAEFDAKLKSGTLTAAEYRQYLEVDPDADRVRLKFKPGALRDAPPPGYDVDQQVYLAERAKQERQLSTLSLIGRPRVMAEGDSWFNLPPIVRPKAIADRLSSNGRVVVKNIARWGHTLSEMLTAKEYLAELPQFNPDWFIFSGGGNDLQESLKRGELVLAYDAARPIDQCLSTNGIALLVAIAEGYRTLLNEIAIARPNLACICFAYDYPRPTFKGGKYIGRYLKKMMYPKSTWNAVAKVMIDRLTASIEAVVAAFPNAKFLDCRGVTAAHPFYDDMHPEKAGFKALARIFEQAFGVSLAAKTTTRKRAKAKPKANAKAAKKAASARVQARTTRSAPKKAKAKSSARRKK